MKTITPIAYFHSPLPTKFGLPRQSGIVKHLLGKVVFEPCYKHEEAIRGLADFDYIWLIWFFSANEEHISQSQSLTVRPPRLGGNERVGVFASRSPFRPNGLGLSSVRLIGIEAGNLLVEGADLMDGTPIYDIKPYIPYCDSHPQAKAGYTDTTAWHVLEVSLSEEMQTMLPPSDQQAIVEILAQDPRPHYRCDDDRSYGFRYKKWEIKFKVDQNHCHATLAAAQDIKKMK